MKIAAIITEYNPFHNGHKYQVDKIREMLGDDTAIIAVMSGNYTQRATLAIADKTIRAEAAVECGVDLVLELPFPFSMSSAEFFAKSGVKIINSLGVVDYLVFGSESGDIDELTEAAKILSSNEFSRLFETLTKTDKYRDAGYPVICETVLSEICGKNTSHLFSPNNILAIEYIKALLAEKSSIIPLTHKREGAGYLDSLIDGTELQSASAIRDELSENVDSALKFVPERAKEIYEKAIKMGKMPTDPAKLDIAVISSFRLNSPDAELEIHDASGGLYNRLCNISAKANSISSLTSLAETKKYTKARIRRAIFNTYFGVTSSVVRTLPAYTQVLAMNAVGRSVLKRIGKSSDFPVITKPSSYSEYGDAVKQQKELSNKADAIYALTLKKPNDGNFSLKFTPYVKK